jgi:septin family protein
MEYLVIGFGIIIVVGLLANRELARDRDRIRRTMREYSFRTYSPGDEEKQRPEREKEEKES